MDPFNPETWKRQWDVLTSAPWVILPLVVLGAVVAWWFRGKIDDGETRALRAQLDLAKARESDAKEKQAEFEKQLQYLRSKTAAGAPKEELAIISARVDTALGEFKAANNAVNYVLTAEPGRYVIKGKDAALTVRFGKLHVDAIGLSPIILTFLAVLLAIVTFWLRR